MVPDDSLDTDRSSLTSFSESDRGLVSGGSSFMDSTMAGPKTDRSSLVSENSSFMDANNTWGVSDMVTWMSGGDGRDGSKHGVVRSLSPSDNSMSVEVSF